MQSWVLYPMTVPSSQGLAMYRGAAGVHRPWPHDRTSWGTGQRSRGGFVRLAQFGCGEGAGLGTVALTSRLPSPPCCSALTRIVLTPPALWPCCTDLQWFHLLLACLSHTKHTAPSVSPIFSHSTYYSDGFMITYGKHMGETLISQVE